MKEFPDRVTLCDDGVYRWSYAKDPSAGMAGYRTMIVTCAVIGVVVFLVFAILETALMVFGLLVLLGMVLLPALAWRLFGRIPENRILGRYEMAPDHIAMPGYSGGPALFERVDAVALYRDRDRIDVHTAGAGTRHVYVRPADYDLVLDYILGRVPDEAEVVIEGDDWTDRSPRGGY